MGDAEAWAVLGETIEGSGEVLGGLCQTLVQATREGMIEPYQWRRMESHLYKYRKVISTGKKHFWPLHQVAPRVRACRRLATLVAAARSGVS